MWEAFAVPVKSFIAQQMHCKQVRGDRLGWIACRTVAVARQESPSYSLPVREHMHENQCLGSVGQHRQTAALQQHGGTERHNYSLQRATLADKQP